ncbi:MAG: type transport system ATP-binding protein [Actinomycetota bacterium]|nr:type transport system ATP-binding protein [Actinomycetota bacterium]
MAEPVIELRGLRKSYGEREAVQGIDLDVNAGEIFAFLGPNGAGKTTTVEIMEGFRPRDGGEVKVLGEDPATAGRSWRARIGVVLQDLQLQPLLTVRESLELYAGYYPSPRTVDETIELVGLAGQRDQRAGKLSGGQQRRLDVALALVGDPELLFLDEPTTGFDPAARRGAWEVIGSLRELGKTVFLTTHYLDEASTLADRVAIIKGGRIVAEGRPSELGADRASRTRIAFALPPPLTPTDLPPSLRDRVTATGDGVEVVTANPVADLAVLTGWAMERGADLPGLQVTRPTLEDVYLELTSEEAPASEPAQ